MKFIILSIILLYVIGSQPPFKDINIEEIINKREKEKKIYKKNRRLKNGKAIFKNPESNTTIFNEIIIETISLIVKAESGTVTYFYIPSSFLKKLTVFYCDFIMYDDQGNKISSFLNITNYTVFGSSLEINTYLPENYELSIKASFKGFNSLKESSAGILYQKLLVEVPSDFKNQTHCKYIFNIDSNAANIYIEYENLKVYNDSAYIYDSLCPTNYLYEIIAISPRQVTWNHYTKITVELPSENPNQVYMSSQVAFLEGSNFNISQDISYTPLSTGKKNNDSFITNHNFYILNYYNFENTRNFYFIKNTTFSSCPNFWNVTDDNIKNYLKNTSTQTTISLVKQILNEDKSDHPDYYKIGKWVYKNIKYDRAHNTKSDPDDILIQKRGVCHHFTLLYNALLNSIGIRTLYTSGTAIKNFATLDRENHAWTVAEINGKWIGLDATWNIFSGKLPQCHVYYKYEGIFDTFSFILPGELENKAKININEELKFVEIVNSTTEIESNLNSQKVFRMNMLVLLILLLIQI